MPLINIIILATHPLACLFSTAPLCPLLHATALNRLPSYVIDKEHQHFHALISLSDLFYLTYYNYLLYSIEHFLLLTVSHNISSVPARVVNGPYSQLAYLSICLYLT